MIVDKAINEFMLYCKHEKNLSAKTLKAYGIDLSQFHKFTVEAHTTEISHIDRPLLRDFIARLQSGYKPRTVRRKLAALKSFFTHLECEDIETINPFRKLRLKLQYPTTLPKDISLPEIERLFQYLYRQRALFTGDKPLSCDFKTLTRDIAIIELLFCTGMRVSELADLRLSNVDLLSSFFRVNGKGSRERIVSFGQEATVSAFKEYLSQYSTIIVNTGCLFVNRSGRKLSSESIRAIVRKHASDAGISFRITPHMFRHTTATLLLEQGVDIRYIQALLGHSSIVTTEIYTKINPRQQNRILEQKHPRRLITASMETINRQIP